MKTPARKTKRSFEKAIEPEVLTEAPAEDEEADEVEVEPLEDVTEILPPEEERAWEEPSSDSENLPTELPISTPGRFDTLQSYLNEISRYPTLTKEEETKLSISYHEKGDIQAAYKLVIANLRLVVMIAREYQRAARNMMDLIQEGNIGLMEAVKKFDPYRGVRFPSYAVWWVRAYIVRYVMNNWRMVKIGTTQSQRKLFFNLAKEKERLEKAGFLAEPKLLAEKLDVKESEVVEMQQRMSSHDVSIDAPLDEESDSSLLNIIPNAQLSAEDFLVREEAGKALKSSFERFAKTLNPKEAAIFSKRLLSEEKATLDDLATEFSLSRERIRQIESRLIEKLKAFLEDQLDDNLIGS